MSTEKKTQTLPLLTSSLCTMHSTQQKFYSRILNKVLLNKYTFFLLFIKKNPAYWLSRPMRIGGPIFFSAGVDKEADCIFAFPSQPLLPSLPPSLPLSPPLPPSLPLPPLPPPPKGGGERGGGGLTNERPQTDHMIWGPIRGLTKNYMGTRHIHIYIYKPTLRMLDRISENLGWDTKWQTEIQY